MIKRVDDENSMVGCLVKMRVDKGKNGFVTAFYRSNRSNSHRHNIQNNNNNYSNNNAINKINVLEHRLLPSVYTWSYSLYTRNNNNNSSK